MKIQVLGSSAGGGLPQWNCHCVNCQAVRQNAPYIRSRSQSSIALSEAGASWLLCNASPDILQQIRNFPPLHPKKGLRDTGISAVVLLDGQIDHTTGLYMLREHTSAWDVWCTLAVQEDLQTHHPIFPTLAHFCGAKPHTIPIDGTPFLIPQFPSLQVTALPLKSKAAPYSSHRHHPQPGDNIGLMVRDTKNNKSLFYAPGLGEMEPHVWSVMQKTDCVMVDGTFWRNDEMEQLGITHKNGIELGHLPQSGEHGMLSYLDRLPATTRKILIHINNTNPILDQRSHEYQECRRRGVEVAEDGLSIEL